MMKVLLELHILIATIITTIVAVIIAYNDHHREAEFTATVTLHIAGIVMKRNSVILLSILEVIEMYAMIEMATDRKSVV